MPFYTRKPDSVLQMGPSIIAVTYKIVENRTAADDFVDFMASAGFKTDHMSKKPWPDDEFRFLEPFFRIRYRDHSGAMWGQFREAGDEGLKFVSTWGRPDVEFRCQPDCICVHLLEPLFCEVEICTRALTQDDPTLLNYWELAKASCKSMVGSPYYKGNTNRRRAGSVTLKIGYSPEQFQRLSEQASRAPDDYRGTSSPSLKEAFEALTTNCDPEKKKRLIRALQLMHHPDHGGDTEYFVRLMKEIEDSF